MNYNEPIAERNFFIYAFLLPIVWIVTACVEYFVIFSAAMTSLGTVTSYIGAYTGDPYATAGGTLFGLSAGHLVLSTFCFLALIAAVIYFLVIWTGVSKDINTMCEGDIQTPLIPFAAAYLICLIPFGVIYFFYYIYKMQDKMYRNSYKFGATVTWSPLAVLLFAIFLPIVVYAFLITSFNEMAKAYNASIGREDYNSGQYQDGNSFVNELVEPLQSAGIVSARQGLLRCTAGETVGASIIMNNGDSVRLGRDPQKSNIVLRQDKKISREHCVISYRNGSFFITDYSTNGTRLANGTRIERGREVPLGSKAEIHLSEQTTFIVKIKPN